MKIAINGAGVAGPALAFWLLKGGHEPLLIESAPELRTGGYIVDFWGIGYDIAEKMGLVPRIRELGYQVREVRFVDADGRKSGGFPVDVFARMTNDRFTSVRRSDISATIYAALDGKVETIFDDSIARIDDRGDHVHIGFDRSAERDVDLVVGADGLHSRVRQLVFGDESGFETRLGYHVAAFESRGYEPRDELVYMSRSIPGRQISRFSMRDDRTLFLFVFRDEYLPGPETAGIADRKAALRSIFGVAGWETKQIFDAMESAEDIYFDRVSQIKIDNWSDGRVALVGDAAACVSLMAGEGTGLAIAEAYVLGGELAKCGDDHAAAFGRYQALLKPFLEKKQASAAKLASSFAPKTAVGLMFRDLVTKFLRIPFIADYFIGRDFRDDIVLPDYGSRTAGLT